MGSTLTKSKSEVAQFSCNCGMEEGVQYACIRAIKWFKLLNKSNYINIEQMRDLYENLTSCEVLMEYEDQIQKDLQRTFPKCPQFIDVQGQMALKRVLLAFSRYDPALGYVQGMNFIVGSLLYHCNEAIAFWMLTTLFETFEMRDIFEPQLPGLYKHCFVINAMLDHNQPDLYNHFNTHNIMVEMYASDWIFCLFSNIIPIQNMADFYDQFFKHGWCFFYRFCLSMLGVFKEKLLEEDEFSGILYHIKFKTPEKHVDQDLPFGTISKTSPRPHQN
mmetsp:Transcript_8004/g.7502  ORF Transcript_8004/g.7502 Transcript_8004/m.7502 type:complete len:275 (-) Transcript_8004:291-1115(-)